MGFLLILYYKNYICTYLYAYAFLYIFLRWELCYKVKKIANDEQQHSYLCIIRKGDSFFKNEDRRKTSWPSP